MDQEVLHDLKAEISRLLESDQTADALPLLKQAANWGDLESQKTLMAMFWEKERGVGYDPKSGYEYARLGAMNGDPKAMYVVAMMNRDGVGCPKNMEQAFYFMKKAAQAEYPLAYDGLAMLYLNGKGVAKDPLAALDWIRKAKESLDWTPALEKHARLVEKTVERMK